MRTWSVLAALAAVALLSLTASAAEKAKEKGDKLSGSYTKKNGDFELTFDFKKGGGTFVFKMSNGNDGCEIQCKYTRDKEGVVKAELINFEKKGNFPVEKEKGYKFAFKAKKDGSKLVISDVEGEGLDDEQKNVLAGEYDRAPE